MNNNKPIIVKENSNMDNIEADIFTYDHQDLQLHQDLQQHQGLQQHPQHFEVKSTAEMSNNFTSSSKVAALLATDSTKPWVGADSTKSWVGADSTKPWLGADSTKQSLPTQQVLIQSTTSIIENRILISHTGKDEQVFTNSNFCIETLYLKKN